MQDVTQKPQASEAEEAVETMEAAVETAMDADEAHEQAKEEMARTPPPPKRPRRSLPPSPSRKNTWPWPSACRRTLKTSGRRNQNVRKEAFDDGARAFATTLLPVIDNLERAITAAGKNAGEGDSLKSGVEMVLRQMCEAFEKRGITPISRQGEKFDPNLENAVMQGAPEDGEPVPSARSCSRATRWRARCSATQW